MLRYDRSPLSHRLTAEGFLTGQAVVTRVGVFKYINADGTIRRELRHPDDVLEAESLDSLKLKPVTDNHPPVLVNADNAAAYAIGSVGENLSVEGGSIAASFSIHRKDAIEKIKLGKRELSLGYRLDLVEESGVWGGEPYTHRQKNIRYNHLAVVDRARAGAVARIHMDGLAVQLLDDDRVSNEDVKMSDKELQTVHLDGLPYKADPEVAKAYEKAVQAEKQARTDADTLQAQLDEAKAQLEATKAINTDEAIAAAVAERVALIESAKRVVNADSLAGLNSRQIKEAVLKEKGIDVTGKSDEYVSARFDAVMESVPSDADKALAEQKKATAAVNSDASAVKGDMRQQLNQKYHGGKA